MNLIREVLPTQTGVGCRMCVLLMCNDKNKNLDLHINTYSYIYIHVRVGA